MNIAYLIFAHNTPKHLQRLVHKLLSSSSYFIIHIDKKSNIDDFLGISGSNICFTQKRISVFWGDFSQVEAILVLLQTAFSDERRFDRFVLLSGADYPLRSTAYIEQFFERNPITEFMNLVEMPSVEAGKPISRLNTYKLRPRDGSIFPIIRKVLMKVGVLPSQRNYKDYLHNLIPYGGATWWAISRQACEFILNFVKEEVQVVNFFKHTICPDESFFQTIVGNSDFKLRVARNLTYADWGVGGRNPALITEKHLAFFQTTSSFAPDGVFGEGEMLFARKFTDDSENLVERLDKQIREKENS